METQCIYVYPGQTTMIQYGHAAVAWRWDESMKAWIVLTIATERLLKPEMNQ